LNLAEAEIGEHDRICSRHFLHGDPSNVPSLDIGKRFASPKKINTDRGMRALKRAARSPSLSFITTKSKCSSTPLSSQASSVTVPTIESTTDEEPMSVWEPLLSDYSIHQLPEQNSDKESSTALAAQVELLEAETTYLISQIGSNKVPLHFRIEQISGDSAFVRFYTGFASYSLLLNFFEFLGPAVYQLNYWGDQTRKTNRRRKIMPLSPLNQFFLTLVKLKLNLRVLDLARRFGISKSLVSKYFITWVCFLYQHLKEIDLTPLAQQVASMLPCAFQEKYPSTYSVIDVNVEEEVSGYFETIEDRDYDADSELMTIVASHQKICKRLLHDIVLSTFRCMIILVLSVSSTPSLFLSLSTLSSLPFSFHC